MSLRPSAPPGIATRETHGEYCTSTLSSTWSLAGSVPSSSWPKSEAATDGWAREPRWARWRCSCCWPGAAVAPLPLHLRVCDPPVHPPAGGCFRRRIRSFRQAVWRPASRPLAAWWSRSRAAAAGWTSPRRRCAMRTAPTTCTRRSARLAAGARWWAPRSCTSRPRAWTSRGAEARSCSARARAMGGTARECSRPERRSTP